MNLTDLKDMVFEKYKTGTDKGYLPGFKCLNDRISFKKGYSTYILGWPASGKTEFNFELLMNLTEKYGWKHALFTPESGSVDDIVGELCSKYLRKPFHKSNPYAMSENELFNAIAWLSQFFYLVDSDQDYTCEAFYEKCLEIEKDNGIKLDTTTIDPWNDLDANLGTFGGQLAQSDLHNLKVSRNIAKKRNWHNIIVTHAANGQPIKTKDEKGVEHLVAPIPTLQMFAGGQAWPRRAMQVIALWRTDVKEIINPLTGFPMERNEVLVKILKSKPKGVGEVSITPLFYDWKRNRYYEKTDFGGERYAWQYLEDEKPLVFDNIRQPYND